MWEHLSVFFVFLKLFEIKTFASCNLEVSSTDGGFFSFVRKKT